jgi:small subunit ribosomal protein S7
MRRKTAKKRITLPDPKFNEVLVTKFVNNMMQEGKKNLAYNIFYEAIDLVESKSEDATGLEVWKKALNNITPSVEVKSRRVGGATFQIPQPVRDNRKAAIAMQWMILYSRKRNEKTMSQRLANEILAAAKEEGAAFKKKEDTHRMAEANRAFSHFRI